MKSKATWFGILLPLCLLLAVIWFTKDGELNIGTDKDNPIYVSQKAMQEEMQNAAKRATYSHTNPNFSFTHPEGMQARDMGSEWGQNIVLETEKKELGLQISLSLFDEDITITEERIKKDLPDLPMKGARKFSLGGTDGVSFESEGMREIWVVKNKFLYQISGYEASKPLIEDILETWKWE